MIWISSKSVCLPPSRTRTRLIPCILAFSIYFLFSIVPSRDAHGSEQVAERYKRLQFISGYAQSLRLWDLKESVTKLFLLQIHWSRWARHHHKGLGIPFYWFTILAPSSTRNRPLRMDIGSVWIARRTSGLDRMDWSTCQQLDRRAIIPIPTYRIFSRIWLMLCFRIVSARILFHE